METTGEQLNAALSSRFAVERLLGRGGMSSVFLARDLRHDRRVALKVLRPAIAQSVGADRFHREIRIAASLTHPNILSVHDSGEAAGMLFYVMPFVEGESLRARFEREGALPIEEAVRIACEVADALSYAHSHNVVHRDIKPENILLEAGHAVVADFGMACAIEAVGADRLTESGLAVGTPAYMSPEQAAAERIDGRTDQYALACVLYEALAGAPPFTGPTVLAIMARKAAGTIPGLRVVRPDVPLHVERAVTRALASLPADRYATVAEFATELREPSATPAAGRSIGVLPFVNMTDDSETDYFAEGIAEEIITALTRLPELKVAARTSTFAFKGVSGDVREIGRRLGVGVILEGSVRRSGQRLRVAAQLIDVADGYHLWSDRYDRDLADVFAIEDDITRSIVGALEVLLTERGDRTMVRPPTTHVNAYDFYLRGRQFLRQSRKKPLEYARQMFARAIEIDPGYALAWAGVADCCSLLHMYYPSRASDLETADRASARALELAPNLAEAHASRGFALFQLKRVPEAVEQFAVALRLDPQHADAHYFLGRALFQLGQFAEAAQSFEAAASVRDDYQARFFAAQSYQAMHDDAEADAAYRRAYEVVVRHLELNPDDSRAATMCAVSACRTGRRDEGLEWARRALDADPQDAGVRYNVACLYALEGETDAAINCLEDAFRVGFAHHEWVARDPDLDSLRSHPRFRDLVATREGGG
jgi:serine/threonine protein kinase/Flp pilus assembly protein TadD